MKTRDEILNASKTVLPSTRILTDYIYSRQRKFIDENGEFNTEIAIKNCAEYFKITSKAGLNIIANCADDVAEMFI